MAKYLLPQLPPAPAVVDYGRSVSGWTMMANDNIGDCTCAAAGHLIELWTANNNEEQIPADGDIISAYEAITGYNPNDPSTDQGGVELDVLNYWRATGIANHKIEAFVSVGPDNTDHVRSAVYIFGGCYIGLGLPKSAQNQDVWDVPAGGATGDGAARSWGGHAVPVIGYDADGLTVVTWGVTKKMTWNFWAAYCDEAYAILSPDWDINAVAPNGIDTAALNADLNLVTS
jgi:hypothetical protein